MDLIQLTILSVHREFLRVSKPLIIPSFEAPEANEQHKQITTGTH
jgi:hypothetical protein